ncbi:MAG: Hsp70 family protein [Chlamydiota bacterium]|nr:Hsp70 family protein [Chlamydiota bacterium]
MTDPTKYVIGIDLGTTNCTLSYALIDQEDAQIQQFKIPQVVTAGTQDEQFSLPSFVYFPIEEELDSKIAGIDWENDRKYCVGTFARDRGSELPDSLIASAKSWLCHSGIDRRENILPITENDNARKISPVDACSRFLSHLKEAWDHKMGDASFVDQQILITVPASFDPSARQLVQEAAENAGYPEVVLLEEPQAAFYAWINRQGDDWRKLLAVGDRVLVVDVGGGTTDFSLISVTDNDGDLSLERVAVGSHLLLGGDNIDLSLAYQAKDKLEDQGHDIDEWQLHALQYACRDAKEKLFAENSPESVDVTIMGRGSSLIGGTLSTSITREEIDTLVLDGFLPQIKPTDRSNTEKRSGMQQVGLPFAQDPRITCQLAKFLSMTGELDSETMDHFILPTAILFNGGTMKGYALQERIVEVLNSWAKECGVDPVRVLPEHDLDFAVSHGATFYGLSRQGNGIRIKGGTSRSYFIGVEDAVPTVPGRETPIRAVCVVPYGMEEGTEQSLEDKEFAVVLGEHAQFRFFSHGTTKLQDGTEPVVGTTVRRWKNELTELHPIETVLDKGDEDSKTIQVKLRSKVTELGVLELWCEAVDGRKWKLEFDIRE